jgi:hypothetical protein
MPTSHFRTSAQLWNLQENRNGRRFPFWVTDVFNGFWVKFSETSQYSGKLANETPRESETLACFVT